MDRHTSSLAPRRNASELHLVFADGDLPNFKVSYHRFLQRMALKCKPYPYQFVRFYQFLLSASIVTRWMLFIIPVLAIIWVPGILGLTASQRGEVRLLSRGVRGHVRKCYLHLFRYNMGSAFDMVEYMAGVVWSSVTVISYGPHLMPRKFCRSVIPRPHFPQYKNSFLILPLFLWRISPLPNSLARPSHPTALHHHLIYMAPFRCWQ